MVAHTQLSRRDIDTIAAAFALGAVRSFTSIEAGTINSNFRVETQRGCFAVRVNEGKTEADIRYEAALLETLARAGVPAPCPQLTGTGQPLYDHRGHLVSAFPWAPGTHVCGADITSAHARALGSALACLHRAGRPLAARFARAGIYTFERICERARGLRTVNDPVLAPALATIDEEIAWLRAQSDARASAPGGVIHGDLFPENVLFAAGEAAVSALLDFEQASTGSLVYDLAVCINAWCVDEGDASSGVGHRVAAERVRALCVGYCAGHGADSALSDAAWAAMVPVLAIELRAAAMRFTVTRITDVYQLGLDQPDKDYRLFLQRVHSFRSFSCEDLLTGVTLDK